MIAWAQQLLHLLLFKLLQGLRQLRRALRGRELRGQAAGRLGVSQAANGLGHQRRVARRPGPCRGHRGQELLQLLRVLVNNTKVAQMAALQLEEADFRHGELQEELDLQFHALHGAQKAAEAVQRDGIDELFGFLGL